MPHEPPPSNSQQPELPAGTELRPTGGVVWNSEDILKGTKEIQIVHRTETYRLRLTRSGKLILIK